MKIYIVLHHEIFYNGGDVPYRADEMVFYTASSMENALKMIRKAGVDCWSWWEIQSQRVDDPSGDWPEHVGYYDRRGRQIESPPFDKCVKLYKRKQRYPT